MGGHVQHAAVDAGFYAKSGNAQSGENRVAVKEMPVVVGGPGRIGTDQRAQLRRTPVQVAVVSAVLKGHVYAAGQQHRHRTAGTQGGDEGGFVAAPGHTRDHQRPLTGQVSGKSLGHGAAVGGAAAAPGQGNRTFLVEVQRPAQTVQHHGRQMEGAQPVGIPFVIPGEEVRPQLFTPA